MGDRLLLRISLATALLALAVVVLGAWVRLSAAGLSCPDWPTCYGSLTVAGAERDPLAVQRFPQRPLQPAKARKEMVHRYAAASLGALVGLLALLAWRREARPTLPLLAFVLVVGQGVLGRLTVSMQLQPWVVTAHLLGGMTLLGVLWWSALGRIAWPSIVVATKEMAVARLLLLLLVVQIGLGGWTSAHGAWSACTDFPTCGGHWWPVHGVLAAFDNGVTDIWGLRAIQWDHRLGALCTAATAVALIVTLWRSGVSASRRLAFALAWLLAVQLALGIGNVTGGLPLASAAAHNAVAALMLLVVLTINHLLRLPRAVV